MSIVTAVLYVLLGCIVLGLGTERFVRGAKAMSVHWRWSPSLAGVLLIGFGSSMPEIVVSFLASLHGHAGMSVGGAFGSNIINIALVLGLACLIRPIIMPAKSFRFELWFLLLVMLINLALLWQLHLTQTIGLVLLLLLAIYLLMLVFRAKRSRIDDIQAELPTASMPLWLAIFWWLVGLLAIYFASDWVVHGASALAKHFGMSDVTVGLTVVALGTSLPELFSTVISAWHGHPEMALGNVLGSNVFNMLAVLAVPALMSPMTLDKGILTRDFPWMFLVTIILAVFMLRGRDVMKLGKVLAWTLLPLFILYLLYVLI